MYITQVKIEDPEEKVRELVPLLEDAQFLYLSQLGLVEGGDYDAAISALQQWYSHIGNKIEWQCRLHTCTQQATCSELLEDFAGELCTLAEKAYPKFGQKFQLEQARNKFIQGLKSSGIQLALMKEGLETLHAALELAQTLHMVEIAQRKLVTIIKSQASTSQTFTVQQEAGGGSDDIVAS